MLLVRLVVIFRKGLLNILAFHKPLTDQFSANNICSSHRTPNKVPFQCSTLTSTNFSMASGITRQFDSSISTHSNSNSFLVFSMNLFSSHFCRDSTTPIIASWRTLICFSLPSETAVIRTPLSDVIVINKVNFYKGIPWILSPFCSPYGYWIQ